MVQDIICMTPSDNCVDPFQFLGVSQMLGLPPQIAGILGLALGNELRDQDIPQKDLKLSNKYYDYLYMAGGITEKLFSTHIEGEGGNSFVDFGPINMAHMSGLNDAVSISFDNGYFWNLVP